MYRSLADLNNNYTIDMKYTRKKFVLLETCLPFTNENILLVTCALFCVNIGNMPSINNSCFCVGKNIYDYIS